MEQARNEFLMSCHGMQTHGCGTLQSLGQAMQFIPAAEKQAFFDACRLCPELIQRESNAMLFLVHEEFNAWKAAVRLAKYWSSRFELFGPDRAFRPMFDLSGEGALPPATVDLLATGLLAILPPDELGHPVCFVDRTRVPPELQAEVENRRQLGFYLLTTTMNRNPNTSIVMILFFTAKPRFIPGMAGWFTDAISDVFPVKVHAAHIVCRSPRSAFHRFVEIFVPVIMRLASKSFGVFNVTLDIGEYDVFNDWILTEREKSRTSPSTKILSQVATDLAQDSSKSFGLVLLAAAVEQQGEEKSQFVSEVAENVAKVNEQTVLTNNLTDISTGVATGKGHSSDGSPTTSSIRKSFVIPSMVGGHTSQSLSWDGRESVRRGLDGIPPNEKASYGEAIQCVPDLVEAEADLAVFLSLEEGNAHTAANRVASYWNIRKALFKGRAFLPLKQSGGKTKSTYYDKPGG
jgi:hypothetical protein